MKNITPIVAPEITETPMTRDQGFALVTGFQRYSQLKSRKVLTAAEEAERTGLEHHLQRELFVHGSELLGAWIAVIREYQPLVASISALFGRVQMSQNMLAQQAEAEKSANEKPAA